MGKAAVEGGTGAPPVGPVRAPAEPPRADMVAREGVPTKRQRWRQIGSRKVRVAAKLDESKVAWIVRQKAGGKATNREIAEAMDM